MCVHCFDVVIHELLSSSSTIDMTNMDSLLESIPPSTQCPLFVTFDIKTNNSNDNNNNNDIDAYHLRGCIGTLSPRELRPSIGEYAKISAFRDHRFNPISIQEVPSLRVAVSLLVDYEECNHCHDWNVGVHGIIIHFTVHAQKFNATYLPEVAAEQGWSQQDAIVSLIQKAGYRRKITQDLLSSIQCTRYQSSKVRLTYDRYVTMTGNDPIRSSAIANAGGIGGWRNMFNTK
jgi:uncharacterized protein (TIGR00296 family)